MANNSKVVSYRRFEDENGNMGVKFIRFDSNGRQARAYTDLSYSSYWRMIAVTDNFYNWLCDQTEDIQDWYKQF